MRKTSTAALIIASLTALYGCVTDDKEYYLVDPFEFKTVCLVDNKNVPSTFFIALHQAIVDKGLEVKIVKKVNNDVAKCPATVLYEADFTDSKPTGFLRDAKLILLQPDKPSVVVKMDEIGEPVPLLDKMSDTAPTIRDMVNRLLPRGTPW